MAPMPGGPSELLDRLIGELDTALRVVAAPARGGAKNPARGLEEPALSQAQRRHSTALMRVNHAGEIAAQALYRGQAAVARDPAQRDALLQAGREEYEHLAWCADRVRQLGGQTSLLAPVWYAGSFCLGALAGLAGDRISLGFLAETERQVSEHLAGHLRHLPAEDLPSRTIVQAMQDEEIAHGEQARERGAAELPLPVRRLMRATARIMTTVAHRL
jgi:ubiquinone biosynthesis monooxygenase Coq7